MTADANDLGTPILLAAMPQVADPYFQRSVVLLLEHTEEGSFGFIINRPTELSLQQILEDTEVDWPADLDRFAYFGGPVQPQLGTVLFERAPEDEGALDDEGTTLAGLGITQSLQDLRALAAEPPPAFRFFLGYSGWGAGQLMEEMMRNDWVTAPVDESLLFADDPEASWDLALRSIGIDPSALVSIPGEEAN